MGWLGIFDVLSPVFLGLFSGLVAWRLARKTPHENLKALVEIEAALDENLENSGAVQRAIELELRRLDESTVAAGKKWREVMWSQFLDNRGAVFVGSFTVVLSTVVLVLWNRYKDGRSMGGETNQPPQSNTDIVFAVVGLVVGALLVLGATYASYKRDQALLRN
jgi:hypothetical protein